MATAKEQALELVDKFEKRSGEYGAWATIGRTAVAEGLRARVKDPSKISQGSTSLCGPTDLMYSVASDDPVKYVKFLTDLFEYGKGTISKFEITPGKDCKLFTPPKGVHVVDWIALASIRDSKNWFLDYQSDDDEAAGITLPATLAGWFKEAGYQTVVNETNLVVSKDAANARKASDYFGQDYKVCLFINSNMLDKYVRDTSGRVVSITVKHNDKSACPDHWIMLNSSIQITDKVEFKVFTWGQKERQVPLTGDLSIDKFLQNYYGFVACKH